MRRPYVIWAAGIGSLVLLDVALDQTHTNSTLSECTRLAYRTDTQVGRVAFVASWLALSGWLLPHILKRVEGSLST